jgi:peroxiredoxin
MMRTPETDDFATGPAIGEALPDFTLPDQQGAVANFTAARDGKRALVVFHRSARW